MTLPGDILTREYQKFVESDGGNTAVRVVGSSGSTQLDVNNASNDVSGYVGKASGTNADFTTAYTSATTITLSNFPIGVSAFVADDIVSVEQYATDGSQTARYTRDDAAFTMSSDVLTVAGASFVNTDTFVVYTNARAQSLSESVPSAEFKSPSDFTATYTSSTTLTLAGVPYTATSPEIAYIKIIPTGGTLAKVFQNGINGVTLTISSNVITIDGAGTPFASGDAYEVGLNGQHKSYDSSLDVTKTIDQSPLWSRYSDAETLVTAQDLTAAYADFGSEIDMQGYTHLRIAIVADANDSEDVTLKLLGLDESGGSDEYEIEGGTTQALWAGAGSDSKFSYTFDVKGTPFVQLQAIAGTVGATPGDLTIVISKQFRG